MRLLFLDFDGVLNSHEYMRARAPESERGSVMGLDRLAVARVARLLAETEAKVVVSSTWRHNRSVAELGTLLWEHGLPRDVVIGRTPRWLYRTPGGLYAATTRGEEIASWLHSAPDFGIEVEAFVILDDDSDMAHLADRLVKTSFETGLTDADVDRAVAMLLAPAVLVVPDAETVARLA